MGYYIEVPEKKGKAQQILDLFGGRILPEAPVFGDAGTNEAIICVVDNDSFEAAGFCYNPRELQYFKEPDRGQQRPRTWLIMDRIKARELTGYRGT